jgi:hypothetical protein
MDVRAIPLRVRDAATPHDVRTYVMYDCMNVYPVLLTRNAPDAWTVLLPCSARQFEHHISQFAQGESDDDGAPGFDDAETADLDHDVRLDPTVGNVLRTWRGSGIDIRLPLGGAPLGRLTMFGSSVAMQCKIAAHTRCSRALNCHVHDVDDALVQWLLDGLAPGMTSADHLAVPLAKNVDERSMAWRACLLHLCTYGISLSLLARAATHGSC